MKSTFKDLSGKRFGRLIVLGMVDKNKRGQYRWNCVCNCGNRKVIVGNNLKFGNTISCGCYRDEIKKNRKVTQEWIDKIVKANTTHGMKSSKFYNKFYNTYMGLKARCNNMKDKSYERYGGRGIKCLWSSFEEFRDDMHDSYLKHLKRFGKRNTQIDRIDNNGNYCKENCRWATWKEQQSNKRNNVILTFDGKSKHIEDWAKIINMSSSTLRYRFNRGWSPKKILTTPLMKNQFG